MRKQYTPAASADAGIVVFGLLKGSRAPSAGLFTGSRLDALTEAARRQGLSALRLLPEATQRWRDQLARGNIAQNGAFRLQTIRPALLRQLQAMSRPNGARKRAAGADETTPGEPVNGVSQPETAKPPPAGIDLGPNLLGAYRLLDKAGFWIEKLQAELSKALAATGEASEWSFLDDEVSLDDAGYSGGDGWVINGWRCTYPARRRRQRVGSLSLIVDIGKPGRPAHTVGLPCMLVAWSSAAHDWATAVDAAVRFWPPARDTTRLVADCLVQWVGDVPGNGPATGMPLCDGAWYYVVPLSALLGVAKRRSLIVQPVLELLAGTAADEVFAKAPEVLRFSRRKGELMPR